MTAAPATGLREIAAHWRRQADLAPHEAATFRHCADEMDAALAAVPPSPDVAVIRAQRRSHRRADMEAKVAAILFGAVDDETFDRVIAVLREEPHA